jgi:hypothetical protein
MMENQGATMGRETLLPDDILAAILAVAEQTSGETRLAFRGHDSTVQKLFWKLAQDCPSSFMDPFVFSNSGPEPYSPTLSESISRLQLSGLVGRENPDYEILFLRQSAEQYFEKELKDRLSVGDLAEVQRLAQGFLRLIKK